MKTRQFYRGAALRLYQQTAVKELLAKPYLAATPVKDSAYILAMAYPHKPWARRWLRLNGYSRL